MKVPGEARLSFRLVPTEQGTRLFQTAQFNPRGLLGLAYWYAVLPLHRVVFRSMLEAIRVRAEAGVEGAAARRGRPPRRGRGEAALNRQAPPT
jgi:hypothetical protein